VLGEKQVALVEGGTTKGGGQLPSTEKPIGKVKKQQAVVSPLVVNPSEFVLLNFEANASDGFMSPQYPQSEELQKLVLANGQTTDTMGFNYRQLSDLQDNVDYQSLYEELPAETLPEFQVDEPAFNQKVDLANNSVVASNSINDLGFPNLADQVKQSFERQQEVQSQQLAQVAAQPNPSPQDGQQGGATNAPGQQAAPPSAQMRGQLRDQSDQDWRGGVQFERRNRAFQQYAGRAVSEQRYGNINSSTPVTVREGVSRPLWVESRLLLARRVTVGKEVFVQGCWLNWEKIQKDLLAEVADLLPQATLTPVTREEDVDPSRMLATLPVRINVAVPPWPEVASINPVEAIMPAVANDVGMSPIRISLWLAWACMLLAALAVASLLLGVVSLSERRAAFVAAVTHELRTPLTTFRMYAEMLAEGMLPDESKRQAYLETLRAEADRLTHLVSNELSYARLERGRRSGRRERMPASQLLERAGQRLFDRATQAEMEFELEISDDVLPIDVETDPAAIEQILFNLVDNSCKYAVMSDDRRIHLEAEKVGSELRLRVRDHGPGISAKASKRLFLPFSKSVHDAANSAPGVGLGLALCKRLAHELGGLLEIEPPNGGGASFVLSLPVAS